MTAHAGSAVTRSQARRTATLDGLRGIAVIAVVVEHANSSLLPGGFAGVDVFFVLSGYLITGLIAQELFDTGRLDLSRFYSRRVRRIVPASLLATAGTVLLGIALLGPVVSPEVAIEPVSAVFSFSNFLFASRATDYFAASPESSMFLHYWSLAVEEQFYLIWPAMLLLLVTAGRRIPSASIRAWSVVGILVVLGAASLFLAMRGPQTAAFFLLPHRGWELIAGGLLAWMQRSPAIHLPSVPRPAQVAGVMAGAVGLAVVFVLGPDFGRWPGPMTVLIVASTLLLVAGGDGMPGARALANPPLRFFGRISYALYLWHWPLLAAAGLLALPAADPSPLMLAAAVGAAVLVATASTILFEEPIRSSKQPVLQGRRAIAVALGSMTILAVSSAFIITRVPSAMASADPLDAALSIAVNDRARAYADRCYQAGAAAPAIPDCVYGADSLPDGSPLRGEPTKPVVVLFGNSHAMSWFGGVNEWARERGYSLVPVLRLACGAVLPPPSPPDAELKNCPEWRQLALDRIRELNPVLTIVASSRSPLDDPSPWWEIPAQNLLAEARERSQSTILLGDVPRAPFLIPDCLAVHRASPGACELPIDEAARPETAAAERRAAAAAGVHYADPVPWLCGEVTCGWITRGSVGWFDNHHLTVSGARSTLPGLGAALDAAIADPTSEAP
ncbi:MAG TPA: acyltransferase family protein [Candidatus Limnocylindrales bacterium]|nr:acyltransferase family protein [Candidatus Limnocylindrales bacterium]